MDKNAYAVRLASWSKIINEANNSEYSKTEWCRQHDVQIRQFHYWQKKLRDYMLEHPNDTVTNVAVPDVHDPNTRQSFYEIELSHRETEEPATQLQQPLSPSLMLKFGQFQLYIGENVSEDLLSRVIKVAGNA